MIFLSLAFVFVYKQLKQIPSLDPSKNEVTSVLDGNKSQRSYLPESTNEGLLIHHTYYSLSYMEKHEQAEWVSYILTEASLRLPNVKRYKRYIPDYDVSTRSAFHRDYSGSGYTRGHLAPAGDMAFDSLAMKESFFMSNMSPQLRAFNNGIWKELEEQTRDWAFHNDELIIVTGPVLKGIKKTIGKQNKVSVPKYFYKVILDIVTPQQKGLAFIIPNQLSARPLQEYAVTIDSVEALTDIDFFANLLEDNLERKLESKIDLKNWNFSNKRYRLRKDKWNYQ
jgi:endonuclease G